MKKSKKISILGATSTALCQVPTLRKGFEELGYQHTDDFLDAEVEFVFVGNPPFDQYLPILEQKKVIFNVLDTCPHCNEHLAIINKLKEVLPRAHKVTTISESVAKELKEKCNIDAQVIYYPMKPVSFLGYKPFSDIKAVMSGRVNDPNKRTGTAIAALIHAGVSEKATAIVGPENPFYGKYFGIVDDDTLNQIYNSTDYCLMLSKNEGIGLTAIESAFAGAIPIVVPSLSTYEEFWAKTPLAPYYNNFTSIETISNFIRTLENNAFLKQSLKNQMREYAVQNWTNLFVPTEVAKRIIELSKS